MNRPITILHAPTPLGLKPPAEGRVPGVRLAPEALRAAGLHQALKAAFAGEVAPPAYSPELDERLRVRNPQAIARYSVELADAIEPLLDAPDLALVLGGDCSIFLGAALALRRRGRYGVIYIDAHSDCQTPEISQTGGVAGMPLAMATGRGPDLLSDLERRRPYVAERDAVVVGCRDLFDVTADGRIENSEIRALDLDEVRRRGPGELALELLDLLGGSGVDGVWVHLDVDVLDERLMPAVDSPEPGGMTGEELVRLVAPLAASPLVRGVQVTIYDPERDPGGRAGRALVEILAGSLRPDDDA